jgi:sigma-E factor negative regulatory protein RseC
MISERAKIVDVADQHIWVQTIRQSTCGSCQAKPGCGQALLAKFGAEVGLLKVVITPEQSRTLIIGDYVDIGIGESALVRSSLLAYCLPLLGLLAASISADAIGLPEYLVIVCALMGLIAGAAAVKLWLYLARDLSSYEPQLLDRVNHPVRWQEDG